MFCKFIQLFFFFGRQRLILIVIIFPVASRETKSFPMLCEASWLSVRTKWHRLAGFLGSVEACRYFLVLDARRERGVRLETRVLVMVGFSFSRWCVSAPVAIIGTASARTPSPSQRCRWCRCSHESNELGYVQIIRNQLVYLAVVQKLLQWVHNVDVVHYTLRLRLINHPSMNLLMEIVH